MSSLLITAPRLAHRAAVRVFRAALLVVLALPNGAAFAADTPLTLAQAQRLAVARSRTLAAKDHAAAAARDMSVAARQLPDPILKIGVDNLPVNREERFSLTRDSMTQRRLGLMQELTRADKRRLRGERFEREADKSLAEKAEAMAALERETALAWLDLYYARAAAALVTQQIDQAALEILAAESAYRAGRGTQADIFTSRSALAVLEDKAVDLRRRTGNATIALARWIGDAAELPLAPRPATEAIRLDEALLEAELAHHPEIALLARQKAIALTEAQLARADRKADWSVELALQKRGPAYSDMVSIGLSVPLQWDRADRQNRELSAKLAQVEQAEAEREEALRQRLAQVRTLLNDWHTNRQRQVRYRQELIPFAQASTRALTAAYRGGKATLAEVLGARRGETGVRLQALELEQETDRLWAQLNFLFPQTSGSRR